MSRSIKAAAGILCLAFLGGCTRQMKTKDAGAETPPPAMTALPYCDQLADNAGNPLKNQQTGQSIPCIPR